MRDVREFLYLEIYFIVLSGVPLQELLEVGMDILQELIDLFHGGAHAVLRLLQIRLHLRENELVILRISQLVVIHFM